MWLGNYAVKWHWKPRGWFSGWWLTRDAPRIWNHVIAGHVRKPVWFLSQLRPKLIENLAHGKSTWYCGLLGKKIEQNGRVSERIEDDIVHLKNNQHSKSLTATTSTEPSVRCQLGCTKFCRSQFSNLSFSLWSAPMYLHVEGSQTSFEKLEGHENGKYMEGAGWKGMKMGGIWWARVCYLICDYECAHRTCTILSHSAIPTKFMAFFQDFFSWF
jgi:hypothetical protein